jgi:hypothetical protein
VKLARAAGLSSSRGRTSGRKQTKPALATASETVGGVICFRNGGEAVLAGGIEAARALQAGVRFQVI